MLQRESDHNLMPDNLWFQLVALIMDQTMNTGNADRHHQNGNVTLNLFVLRRTPSAFHITESSPV
jgi:hypothetical protein